jgi:secondary thiamine-phosphate synthase enzyme
MKVINVNTSKRIELVDVTEKIRKEVLLSDIEEGVCFLFIPHTTAGIMINENYDPSVKMDILDWLNKKIPEDAHYRHLEGNADAHIKSSLIGNSISIPILKKTLMFGHWQGIFFCEFDGPRSRKIYLSILNTGRKI